MASRPPRKKSRPWSLRGKRVRVKIDGIEYTGKVFQSYQTFKNTVHIISGTFKRGPWPAIYTEMDGRTVIDLSRYELVVLEE